MSILQIDPASPPIVHIGAAVLLYSHIGAGTISIVSGFGALAFRKGSQPHRLSGNIFFISMLIMASIGFAVSPFLSPPEWANVSAGLFTLYLVITSWTAVKRKTEPDRFDTAMLIFGLAIAVISLCLGAGLFDEPGNAIKNKGPAWVFAGIVVLAALGDFRMILRRGLDSTQRLIRHLWRMCLALGISAGSLFGGQQQLFPKGLRESGLLNVPILLVLIAMLYWFIRVRFGKKNKLAFATR
jgi:hypothetical protein